MDRGRILADGPAAEILGDAKLLERARLEPLLLTKLFKQLDPRYGEITNIPFTIDQAAARLSVNAAEEVP